MTTLKLTQIGNSLGVVLPKELLAKLKVGKGDSLFVTDAAQGVTLTPYDPEFERQIAVARQISRKRRDVLRVRADPNLSHCADRILSQGRLPVFEALAVDKCRVQSGSLTSFATG